MGDDADHTRRWLIHAGGAAVLSNALTSSPTAAQDRSRVTRCRSTGEAARAARGSPARALPCGRARLVRPPSRLGPHPSPNQILAHLEQTATPLGGSEPNENYGWGLVNAGAATAPLPAAAPAHHG